MNDLRLPGLNAPLGPATRADSGARGATDAGEFDAALLRSAQRANPAASPPDLRAARAPENAADRGPDRTRERAADAALARRRDSDSNARSPRDADQAERAPARRAERMPDRDPDNAADGVAERRTVKGDARADAGTDARAPRSEPAPEQAPSEATAGPAPATERADDPAGDLAPFVSALAPATTDATSAPLAAAVAAAVETVSTAEAAPTEDTVNGPESPAADGLQSRSAPAAPHATAGKTVAVEVEAHTDTVHTPVKDRLIEDFERRYENALGRAAGMASGSPLAPASPLAAAGLPPTLAGSAPAMTVAYASVPTPIGHPAFGQDLSHRILLFAGQHVQSAEISVTPADLGPIRVAIEVRGQEAAMQFSAAHATTRAAIEDALPRLREMLAAQGLQLTQADVGDRSQRGTAFGDRSDARPQSGQGDARGGATARLGALGATGTETANVRRIGLIDIRV